MDHVPLNLIRYTSFHKTLMNVAQTGWQKLPAGLPQLWQFEVIPVRRLRSSSKGQATVEMALVLPLLIWLLVGLVDVARMANAYLIIQHASREAVRLGVTGASDTAIAQRALVASTTLDTTRLVVNISPAGTRTTGSDVTVRISYSYQVLALMGIIGNDVPLTAQLTARVE